MTRFPTDSSRPGLTLKGQGKTLFNKVRARRRKCLILQGESELMRARKGATSEYCVKHSDRIRLSGGNDTAIVRADPSLFLMLQCPLCGAAGCVKRADNANRIEKMREGSGVPVRNYSDIAPY